jgi:hypothetical protein
MEELNIGAANGSDESAGNGWDNVDISGVSDAEDENPGEAGLKALEADWYGGEVGVKKGEKEKSSDHTAGLFALKHLDRTLSVDREELIRLAQKGLDYDRVKSKYSELVGGKKQTDGSSLLGGSNSFNFEIDEFLELCPEVNVGDISPKVWEEVARGKSLISAYTRVQNESLRAELEAERQNRKNRESSVSSRSSEGRAASLSELERLWYTDD